MTSTAIFVWAVFIVLATTILLPIDVHASAGQFLVLSVLALVSGMAAIVVSPWAGRVAVVAALLGIGYFRGFEIFAFTSWMIGGFAP